MVNGKNAVLLVVCLAVAFSAAVPIMSSLGVGGYDLWLDVNDDGQINIIDVAAVATAFGTSGRYQTKASLHYDSGWVNLAGQTSQNYTLTHSLNLTSADMIVDARQKTQGWNKTYGGENEDYGVLVIQTSDGAYAMVGSTSSFGAGGDDFWLIKTDANGNALWNKTYGGTGDDWAKSLIKTSDGGYALAGFTSSFGAGSRDFWLVKIDANGSMQLNKTYGGIGDECAFSMTETSDGRYVIAGWTDSFGAGNADVWLVETDGNGNALWNKTYGGAGIDCAFSMTETSDTGYALGGRTSSFGAGGDDFWLIKTDANGNVLWNKTYGGGSNEEAWFTIQTVDGGYALAGFTASFGTRLGFNGWLVKTDAVGNMIWNQTYDDGSIDSVIQMSDGGYVLAGSTTQYNLTTLTSETDALVVKTDVAGNMIWNQTYGGLSHDRALSVIQNRGGSYIIAGSTGSFGAGKTDGWLIKTDVESGLAWVVSTVNSVTLVRDVATPWSLVRVQIWKKR